MKILVIPDIHEDLDFLAKIESREDFDRYDHIVCLGDYFDPRLAATDEKLKVTAIKIRELKSQHGEKLHLLCGNHDLPYYALRPDCIESPDRPNFRIGFSMAYTKIERAKVINEIWDESCWKQLKGAVLLDGILFSHAGIHPVFWPDAPTSAESCQLFSAHWQHAFASIYEEEMNPLFSIGKARKDSAPFGGPLWMDWEHEFIDALEVPQVVGHTRWPEEPLIGRSRCIDLGQVGYGVINDGEFREKLLR
jgi:predicted phosphodiesterase